MRRTIGIVMLTLTSIALVAVLLWRWVFFDDYESRYPATLYFAQIRAIDDETSKPVDFTIKWDYESITPFSKGSGPAMIEINNDKTVTVALVGLPLKGGLPLTIAATDYVRSTIHVRGDQSGFLERPAQVEKVRLRRSNSQSPPKRQTEESEQDVHGNTH